MPPGQILSSSVCENGCRQYTATTRSLFNERVGCFKRVVEAFAAHYSPDPPILIVRAPGRVNIMGRHIDHQWGRTNLMAIDREVVMAEKIDKLIYTSKEQKE